MEQVECMAPDARQSIEETSLLDARSRRARPATLSRPVDSVHRRFVEGRSIPCFGAALDYQYGLKVVLFEDEINK